MKRPTPSKVRFAAEAIGKNLGTWRRMRGLTMQQLAEKANVSRPTMARLEHGDPSVSLETFLGACVALGIGDQITDATDPYETDFGRLRADQELPQRVRR